MQSTQMMADIRPAQSGDFDRVAALLTENNLPLDGIAPGLEGFLVAEFNNELVGVAGVEACCNNALLRSVAVRDAWKGKGLGRALVTEAIARAEAQGVNALYLLTTTAESYFPSFGFAKLNRDAVPADVRDTVEFRSACPASATAMVLPLRG